MIINSAAMNLGVHIHLSVWVSSMYVSSSGIAGSYGSSVSRIFSSESVRSIRWPKLLGWCKYDAISDHGF